jgi:hypothetical protein
MPQHDNYRYLGIGLISFGVIFTVFSYWMVVNTTFTAFGLSCIILGATLLMIPSNPVPSQQIRAMIEGSLVTIEALLEEYDANGRATYLPPNKGRVNCFIPLKDQDSFQVVDEYNFPLRILTKIRNTPGLIVFPPGSEIVRLALLPDGITVEDALNYVLVDFIEIVKSVKSVEEKGEYAVELIEPRSNTDFPRVNRSLGSISVSVVGCVIAYISGKPVFFNKEEISDGKIVGFFKIAREAHSL